ncbi:TIM barrel protein [Candidatus Solirubrobacter pratensis]|uniref:TIM barrel protein n=1 Tax=Candidatus Solirubrobacter pratensis TaxID=1298857 RepID=UPI00042A880F|nr:TIM barrel protein [Candidatus Solirubrobacter pratensis]
MSTTQSAASGADVRAAWSRIAAAPISWGVCEVPGWGHQMEPDRVLAELRAAGPAATEAGPEGFLPDDPRGTLAAHDLSLVGAFVPAVLHEPGGADEIERAAARLAAAGAGIAVVAAIAGADDYDSRPELTSEQWATLLGALDEGAARAAHHGVRAVLHPHMGTVIESQADVDRVLEGSSIALCLDTGHLMVGGADPVALAEAAGDRVEHVHLKDVDGELCAAVRAGAVAYSDAVRQGLYCPLGQGAVDVPRMVRALERHGYAGWYVLEQDVMLAGEPAAGAGPAAEVRASAEYLAGVLEGAAR